MQYLRAKVLSVHNRHRVGAGQAALTHPIIPLMLKENSSRATDFLRDRIDRLLKLSRDLGFKTFFIVLPDRNRVDEARLREMLRYYSLESDSIDPALPGQLVSQILRENGIPHADLLDCLREHPDPERLYYVQDDHLTVEGHSAVAACLERLLPA